MNTNIKVISIEQDHQNETTRVWFNIDGEQYAIEHSGPETKLIDSDGYPIEDQNDHDRLKEKLLPLYNKVADDFCGEDCAIDPSYNLNSI